MSLDAHTSALVIETARQARLSHRQSFDGTDSEVVRLPEAALTELVRRLVTAVDSQICQIVPFSPRKRVTDQFSHLVLGELASFGATVQRLYLVPAGYARGGELHRRLADDGRRNIEARSLMVGAGAAAPTALNVPGPPMRDVWLVDDQVVIRQEFGSEGPPVWVVSVRAQDVEETRSLWQNLWPHQSYSLRNDALLNVNDPLLESADMIHSAAQLSCTGDHIDEVSCSWYHGVWQYLRLFNMVSSPRWHPDFYLGALSDQLGEVGAQRVLISGTADYAVLAFVLAAAEKRGHEMDIHVVDLCPTPLFACRWYARRVGVNIQVHPLDLLGEMTAIEQRLAPSAGAHASFDLIVSDAFLTRFSREQSNLVLQRWAAMLRPNGTVVTTVRLHPRNGDRHGVAQDVSDFLLRLRTRADNWRWLLQVEMNELLDAGREYALKMTSRDLGDLDDVLSMFSTNGFEVLRQETARVEGELCETEYVRIVAALRGTRMKPRYEPHS